MAKLQALRPDIIKPAIAKHAGRLFNQSARAFWSSQQTFSHSLHPKWTLGLVEFEVG